MTKSWEKSLHDLWSRLQKQNSGGVKTAVIGVGHELQRDDAVGVWVARWLRPFASETLCVIEGAHAPENTTGRIRKFAPDLVLFVDAAVLDEPPGTIRWIDWQQAGGMSATTHTLPLDMISRYLIAETGCEVGMIGIQPADMTYGESMSEAVAAAGQVVVDKLVQLIS